MDDALVADARVTALWALAARRLMSGFRHFVPTIVLTWLVAGVAAARVPAAPWLAQGGLGIVCFFFLTASAARAASVTGRAPMELAISRAGACVGPLIVAMILLALSVAALGVGARLGGEDGAVVGLGAMGVVVLAVWSRVWPVFSLPYFVDAPVRWSPAARASVWTGPSLGRAFALTRRGAGPETVAMVVTGLAGLGLAWLAQSWLPSAVWNAALDIVLLPYLAMFNLLATARVMARVEARA